MGKFEKVGPEVRSGGEVGNMILTRLLPMVTGTTF